MPRLNFRKNSCECFLLLMILLFALVGAENLTAQENEALFGELRLSCKKTCDVYSSSTINAEIFTKKYDPTGNGKEGEKLNIRNVSLSISGDKVRLDTYRELKGTRVSCANPKKTSFVADQAPESIDFVVSKLGLEAKPLAQKIFSTLSGGFLFRAAIGQGASRYVDRITSPTTNIVLVEKEDKENLRIVYSLSGSEREQTARFKRHNNLWVIDKFETDRSRLTISFDGQHEDVPLLSSARIEFFDPEDGRTMLTTFCEVKSFETIPKPDTYFTLAGLGVSQQSGNSIWAWLGILVAGIFCLGLILFVKRRLRNE